jgi:hypothetical protein
VKRFIAREEEQAREIVFLPEDFGASTIMY